jgi:type IV pilus biogenesis protein CpaD/CtpE
MMTNEQLDELERLEQAATPGPWVEIGVDDAFCASRGGILHASEVDNEWEEQHWIVVDEGPAPANWVPVDNDGFIAAARNALPELIKDLREARAEVARLRRWAERPPTSTAAPGSAEAIRFAAQCRCDFGAAPALAPDAQPDDAVLP